MGELIKNGRIHTEHSILSGEIQIEVLGYLDDESFDYAYRRTKHFYNSYYKHKKDILEKIKNLKKFTKRTRAIYNRFKKNFDWIIQNLNLVKIKPNDSQEFGEMQNFIFQQINFQDMLLQKNKIAEELFNKIIDKKILLSFRRV